MDPMHNERIDKRVDAAFREILDAADFGFAEPLTSFRKAIELGSKEIDFFEVIVEKSGASNDPWAMN